MDATDPDVRLTRPEGLCGYSGCRRQLPSPAPGGGRRPLYCTDRHWNAGGRVVSCKQLGNAEQLLTAVQGGLPGHEAVLGDLHTALTVLATPTEQVLQAINAAITHLDEETTSALQRAEKAEARAVEAEGLSQIAQREAKLAQNAQKSAEAAQGEAEQRAKEAEETAGRALVEAAGDRETAAVARGAVTRLENEAEHLRKTVSELQGHLNGQTARAERAEAQHKAVAEEADRLRAQLEKAHSTAVTEREHHLIQLKKLRTEHYEHVESLKKKHNEEREKTTNGHNERVASLLRQAGRADVLAEHLTVCEAELERARNGLTTALSALAGQKPTDHVLTLLQKHLSPTESEHAAPTDQAPEEE